VLNAAAERGQWAMRDRHVYFRGYAHYLRRATGAVAGQPGQLRAHRHAAVDSPDANTRHRNVRDIVNIDFPFHFDTSGRSASTGTDEHVRDMIEQLLFTNRGERVNRPDFGSGLMQLIFAPNSPELASALQFTIQASLQQWLEDVVDIVDLEVVAEDSSLRIVIQYVVRRTNEKRTAVFTQAG
jgi:phage baseplate assembly protein W